MDKARQRGLGYAAREAQTDKDAASIAICRRFQDLVEQRHAHTVMWYLHCRSEVRTLPAVFEQLRLNEHRIVIPFCTQDGDGNKCLGLWHLQSLDELRPGMWRILEPPRQRWLEAEKLIKPDELDAILVPGVAFDSSGARLGNGAGYYDRLLAQVRPDTLLAGACFQRQLLDRVSMEAHDVYMNWVLTERAAYRGLRYP